MKHLFLVALPVIAVYLFFKPQESAPFSPRSIAEMPQIPSSYQTITTKKISDSPPLKTVAGSYAKSDSRRLVEAENGEFGEKARAQRAREVLEKTRPQRVAAKPDQSIVGKGVDRECDIDCQRSTSGYSLAGIVYRIGDGEKARVIKKGDAKLKPLMHLQLN